MLIVIYFPANNAVDWLLWPEHGLEGGSRGPRKPVFNYWRRIQPATDFTFLYQKAEILCL